MILFLYLGIFVAIICTIGGIIYLWLDYSARKEVNSATRIPMVDCPKHGMFPKKLMFTVKIPMFDSQGKDLEVEVCPFCYDEKSKKADDILKLAKEGKL